MCIATAWHRENSHWRSPVTTHCLTLLMWNQFKGGLNLPSNDTTLKSQNIILLVIFSCLWQRCNSKSGPLLLPDVSDPRMVSLLISQSTSSRTLSACPRTSSWNRNSSNKTSCWRSLAQRESLSHLCKSSCLFHAQFWLTQTVGAAVFTLTMAKWERLSISTSWWRERKILVSKTSAAATRFASEMKSMLLWQH